MNFNSNSNSNGGGKKKKKTADNDNYIHCKKSDHKEFDYFIKYSEKISKWWSKKYGDFKKDNKFKDDGKSADSNKGLIVKSGTSRDDNWYLDSCTFFHITADKDRFINLKPFNSEAADNITGKEITPTVIRTI